jgi:hypothetical protein
MVVGVYGRPHGPQRRLARRRSRLCRPAPRGGGFPSLAMAGEGRALDGLPVFRSPVCRGGPPRHRRGGAGRVAGARGRARDGQVRGSRRLVRPRGVGADRRRALRHLLPALVDGIRTSGPGGRRGWTARHGRSERQSIGGGVASPLRSPGRGQPRRLPRPARPPPAADAGPRRTAWRARALAVSLGTGPGSRPRFSHGALRASRAGGPASARGDRPRLGDRLRRAHPRSRFDRSSPQPQ